MSLYNHAIARIRRCISVIIKSILPNGSLLKNKLLLIKSTYSLFQFKKLTNEKRFIRIYTKKSTDRPGLADRLKAFLSGYIVAKENGYQFYIYHDAGFKLTEYLQPNEVDWRIKKQEIHWGINRFKILWQMSKFETLSPKHSEYHAHFASDIVEELPVHLKEKYTYAETFRTLFKPSFHLKKLIEAAYQELQLKENSYIAVHVRFMDFFEAVEQNPENTPFIKLATEEEQQTMIKSIHATLEAIHQDNQDMPILLFSDSTKFMNVPHPSYVHQLSGMVGHIYTQQGNKNVTDKAFTDLFIIAGASKVISIVGEGTLQSGYSKTAAALKNKPFYRIERVKITD